MNEIEYSSHLSTFDMSPDSLTSILNTFAQFHMLPIKQRFELYFQGAGDSRAVATEKQWANYGFILKEDAIPIPLTTELGVSDYYQISDINIPEGRNIEKMFWRYTHEVDAIFHNLEAYNSPTNWIASYIKRQVGNKEDSDSIFINTAALYIIYKRMGLMDDGLRNAAVGALEKSIPGLTKGFEELISDTVAISDPLLQNIRQASIAIANNNAMKLENIIKAMADSRWHAGDIISPFHLPDALLHGSEADLPAEEDITVSEPAIKDASQPKSSGKIEDFGEWIGGARKDLVGKTIDKLNAVKLVNDFKALSYAKSWPEPSYQRMLKNDIDPDVISLCRALRDAHQKPRSIYALGTWAEAAKAAKDISIELLAGTKTVDEICNMLTDSRDYVNKEALAYFHLYRLYGHGESFKKLGIDYNRYRIRGSYDYELCYVARYARKQIYSDTLDGFLDAFKKAYTPPDNKSNDAINDATIDRTLPPWAKNFKFNQTDKAVKIEPAPESLYESRALRSKDFASKAEALAAVKEAVFNERIRFRKEKIDGEEYYSIFKRLGKKGDSSILLRSGFKTEDEARAFATENFDKIMMVTSAFSESSFASKLAFKWSEMRSTNAPDRRGGIDVTPEQFSETFGFRGVQFGNWNNQGERQSLLNASYDALFDLADVLGVQPEILSLNGELGIAFGARGHGLSSAKAHFEPAYTVINLTKEKGAGSLAHEWLHALDNYLMIKGGILSNERTADGSLKHMSAAMKYMASDKEGNAIKNADLPASIKDAMRNLMVNMRNKTRVVAADLVAIEKSLKSLEELMDNEITAVRQYLEKERSYGRKKAPATAEQLEKFDCLIKEAIIKDKVQWNVIPGDGRSIKCNWISPPLIKIDELYKDITGRSMYQKDKVNALGYAIYRMQTKKAEYDILKDNPNITHKGRSDYYENSSRLGRTYWTDEWEMAARAFSSYVEDKLNTLGYKSNFLNHSANNEDFQNGNFLAKLFNAKIYPEGEEREKINKDYDAFFDSIRNEIREVINMETGAKTYHFSIQAEIDDIADKMGDITLEQVETAFKGCDVNELDNDMYQINLPNGESLFLNVSERLLLTEDQKEGLDYPYDINEANGYYINGQDSGVISISKVGEKGTLEHELYHVAQNFLTDEERNILKARYGDEEHQAEAYKSFILDGKMPDSGFATISTLLDGTSNLFRYRQDGLSKQSVEEIFRDIKEGRVWEKERTMLPELNVSSLAVDAVTKMRAMSMSTKEIISSFDFIQRQVMSKQHATTNQNLFLV